MALLFETACLVLVGALWGCTNPLLRKGSTETASSNAARITEFSSEETSAKSITQWLLSSLAKFWHVEVWLPYCLNQAGSVLYYFTLANSDLSLAVPICNALSLVFSILTSYLIGEKIEQPVKTVAGAALVMGGVALCLFAQGDDNDRSTGEQVSTTGTVL